MSALIPYSEALRLDAELVRVARGTSALRLAVGDALDALASAGGHHELGFSSLEAYARERCERSGRWAADTRALSHRLHALPQTRKALQTGAIGWSTAELLARHVTASRAARVPELATALSSGRIGDEAAYLLSRIVTQTTAEEWIHRAEQRTVKHLREEVEAAELLIRMGDDREQLPLDEQSLDMLSELERYVVSGELVGRNGDSWAGEGSKSKARGESQMSGNVSARDGARTCDGESQMSGVRSPTRVRQRLGRVTLRWSVTERTYRFWHALERIFVRVRARVCREPTSFLRFLCENFCRTWLPALRRGCLTESGELPEYFHIYRRDAFRCSSPVCRRRDVTPHHLVFRSHGGGDDDENVASLCSWCHLCGVHEGRIAAEPTASRIRWRIGRSGTLRIDGRVRRFHG